jgi:hypothetical protein
MSAAFFCRDRQQNVQTIAAAITETAPTTMPAISAPVKPDSPVLVLVLEQVLEVESNKTRSAGTEPGTTWASLNWFMV